MTMLSSIRSIFSEKGALSSLPAFEFRPQQRQMAEAIASALMEKRSLIIEAPTGVGKGLAYLIPALLFAKAEGKKAIVSTHTKNLQEQLLQNDIAIIRSLLDLPFSVATFKGRGNYLCTTRLASAVRQQRRLFSSVESDQLDRIDEWSHHAVEGSVDELPFSPTANVWSQVCSEKGICGPAVCRHGCFFQIARHRARTADLVIMNHSLFFALLALQESEEFFIFKDDFVIFDEAHTLEQVACAGMGKSLSRFQVLYAVRRLFNGRTRKGLFSRPKMRENQKRCAETEKQVDAFFDEVLHVTKSLSKGTTLRVRERYLVSDSITGSLKDLRMLAQDVSEQENDRTAKEELVSAARLIGEAEVLIREFLELPDPTATYWIELGPGRQANVILHAAPTSVADSAGTRLFREGKSVIMTSGTLSVGGSLSYFQQRLGAEVSRTLVLDSPFDFRRQMKILLVRDMPPPDDSAYEEALPGAIYAAISRSHGKALVLFTNATLMRSVGDRIRDSLESDGLTLLVQDGTMPRHRLLQLFKSDVRSVLFGLDSFWMGIDVPGEALEHVIITKLPFSVPDHPLVEARMELIARQGGNAFRDYILPEAILKLRQGVGRLIRSKTDKGVITVLDSRILRKQYGRIFLASLPRCPIEVLTEDGSLITAEMWEEDSVG